MEARVDVHVCDPTGSRKPEYVRKFLVNLYHISDTPFQRIVLHYAQWLPSYRELGPKVEFCEGLPRSGEYSNDRSSKLVIVDDLMRESSAGNGAIINLLTESSHDCNASVIFVAQNDFHQGRGQRDVSPYAYYIVLFRNLRDRAQIGHLDRKIYPENPLFLQEAYVNTTSGPYGYLLLNLEKRTPNNLRFHTFFSG